MSNIVQNPVKNLNTVKHSILVTGGGGFIGSHLVERLVMEGARVRVFMRYNSRADHGLLRFLDPALLAELDLFFGDLRDAEAVQLAMKGVDTVFHLGALIAIPYSYHRPREVVETNVTGTLNILMAARNEGIARLVHTSSSEVYGSAQYLPMNEAHPLRAQSPYAASKIAADQLVESFVRSFRIPAITLRPFNTFGPRQSCRAIIPTIMAQILSANCHSLHLGDLSPCRDFTYVADTVDGFIRAAATPGIEGETINLGSGKAISIGDLARTILEISNCSLPVITDPLRLRPTDSEVNHLLSDNRKAFELLNWAPTISLATGLRQTLEWQRGNLSGQGQFSL